jgi:quercetin dioxygenase-like cupin family protein
MTARLSAPLLAFDLTAEIEQLKGEEHWVNEGRISKTLVKHSDFRIVLMFMKAGTLMQEHKTDARISIHSLSGRLLIRLDGRTVELPPGHLLVLEKSLSHDVKRRQSPGRVCLPALNCVAARNRTAAAR